MARPIGGIKCIPHPLQLPLPDSTDFLVRTNRRKYKYSLGKVSLYLLLGSRRGTNHVPLHHPMYHHHLHKSSTNPTTYHLGNHYVATRSLQCTYYFGDDFGDRSRGGIPYVGERTFLALSICISFYTRITLHVVWRALYVPTDPLFYCHRSMSIANGIIGGTRLFF